MFFLTLLVSLKIGLHLRATTKSTRASADASAHGQDHDALDLTDNDIPSLTNFPLFPRLTTLLLARNRIAHIAPTLPKQLPNLTMLVLTGNKMRELADLEALGGCRRLTHLVLAGNPVAGKEVR